MQIKVLSFGEDLGEAKNMNTIQLFLNDHLADLSEDSPIALTFQINDLAEVKNQQGNTSNRFKLPLTQNNRAILAYADDIAITDTTSVPQIPYTRLSARIIQNGIEILPNAIAEINEVDDDTVSITILSGNVDFFDALGGQVADMGDSTSRWSNYGTTLPWEPFDHIWNLENAANSQQNTEKDGWIYPVVDYGKIDPADFTQPIDVRYQRPGFFVKKAIDILVQSTGYTATGSLLADPLYPLLIAQFSNSSFEHGANYRNNPDLLGCSASISGDQLIYDASPDDDQKGTAIKFNILNSDPSNTFNPGDGVYTAPSEVSVDLSFTFSGRLTGALHTYPLVLTIFFEIYDGAGSANVATATYYLSDNPTIILTAGSFQLAYIELIDKKIAFSTVLAKGQQVRVYYNFAGGDRHNTVFDLYSGANFRVITDNQQVLYTQMVQCERILPDMSQADFLKDTFQRFGIICQTDVYNKTINFASLKDIIYNILIANDWTSKCIDHGKQLNYKLGSYAQINNLEYQTDPNILPLKLGWDQLIINDQTLSAVPTDLIVSKFGPSTNRPYIGGTIAQINMIDPSSEGFDFSVSVAPRLLIDQKLQLNGTPVTFVDGSGASITKTDVISTPYFYKPDGQYNLCWCDMESTTTTPLPGLKNTYYAALQKILQNTKVLVRYFLLTPRDIAELDLLVPVYLQQHNAYFYINKIDSWRKGQPCKVELVRIG